MASVLGVFPLAVRVSVGLPSAQRRAQPFHFSRVLQRVGPMGRDV